MTNWTVHFSPTLFLITLGAINSSLYFPLLVCLPNSPTYFYISFCVKSSLSELNPQSAPLVEPLSCRASLTLTPLFISGMQLSPSQVRESLRERQECKPVSQISTNPSTVHTYTHFSRSNSLSIFLSLALSLSPFSWLYWHFQIVFPHEIILEMYLNYKKF